MLNINEITKTTTMGRYLLIFFLSITVVSCNKEGVVGDSSHLNNKAALANFVEVLADTNNFPPVITPEYVYLNGEKTLFLDMRPDDEYKLGHIDNSRNVGQGELLHFFKYVVHPSSYEDVVLVSQCGQGAVYAASLLQLIGYHNVYALRYGMAGWNKSFSFYYHPVKYQDNDEYWESGSGPKPKQIVVDMEKFSGIDWRSRVASLLSHSVKDFLIQLDDIFRDPDKYVILDYRAQDVYQKVHLKGSINFPSDRPFDNDYLLSLLPENKPVVVYSCHPYNAISLMAYLRLLGYDAYALSYGFHELLHQRAGKPFEPKDDFKQLPVISAVK